VTVVDLHPEELLDKDARGELTADESVRLESHLARCSACRAERLLRADFADELDGDDRDSAILGLVQGALAAPRPVEPVVADANVRTTPPRILVADLRPELDAVPGLRRRPRRTAIVLLVAAACLAASAAGATGLTARVWQSIRGESHETTHVTTTGTATVAPAPRAASPAPPSAVSPTELAPPEVAPAPEEAMVVSPVAVPVAPHAPARALAPVGFNTPPPPPATAPAPAPTPAPSATSAGALFESANTARRSGDTATALSRYEALEKQFPGTREARVAKATTGKLLLDRGDASGALARFDAYLASGSSELREEAMAGRATALERLGREEEESRAWAALLATYPATPYAAHARVRVGRPSPR